MINLHLLEKAQSQRTIDLVCGAAMALNGNPKRVGDGMFVFAPSNVVLSTDTNSQPNKFDSSAWSPYLQQNNFGMRREIVQTFTGQFICPFYCVKMPLILLKMIKGKK